MNNFTADRRFYFVNGTLSHFYLLASMEEDINIGYKDK